MLKALAAVVLIIFMPWPLRGSTVVDVKPPNLHSPRPLEEQTATSAVRDYLQSWKAFKSALERNRASLLEADFVGVARDKLRDTIREQARAGIHTSYQDQSHNIQIVFYSPDGLSIQLVDKVVYEQRIFKGGKLLATQPVHARYVVVMTPAAARWLVRIFQAVPQ